MKSKHLFMSLLVPLLTCTQMVLPALEEKGNISKLTSQNFTLAAKKVTPSVVSIKAVLSEKKSHIPYEDQLDPMQEEIWRRFFGIPYAPQRPEKQPAPVAQGSGFVVTSDGKILTNNHVIEDAEKISVIFSDGTEYPATVVGRDANTDIALLQIDAKDLPYLTLANSDDLEVGEWVIACGNLLGFQTSITVGVVSAKGRNELDMLPIEEFIQTDAAINRGNSGGPLLNLDAEVVGMNTAFATNTGGYLGLGFAIPSNMIQHVMQELIAHGKVVRGYLGVALQRIDSDLAQAFKLSKVEGALVTDVAKDGPAEKAGVQPGDVILQVNGQPINNSGALRKCISLLHPGEEVALTIRRNDTEMQLQAILGTYPEHEESAQGVQNSMGVVVQELTTDLAKQHGYSDEKGVLIKHVDPTSVAYQAGLRPGQLILSVNRTEVTSPAQFYTALKDLGKSKQILLHVKAGQSYRFISIKL